jgi:trigger factor
VKVTVDKTENRQAHLTIEMEPPEVELGLKKAYGRLVQKYAVPGFRKGKTPRPILEQYLGKEAFTEDAVEHMAPEAYENAVKEQGLKPIAQPQIELEKVEPVTYKVVVPLEPVVKLGDYHQIKIAPESVELKEDEIDRSIEQLRHQFADWVIVDRQINTRDSVTLDIESAIGAQPYINQKDAQFEVEKGSEFPMPGFSEQLIGLKKGESKEFKLNFPAEYPRSELAGKEATFKVSIKEIKQETLPEVNDEFAVKVNPDFKTAAELRSKVTDNLKRIAEDRAKSEYAQKVVEEAVKLSEIEYPPVLEEEEIDNLMRQQMQRWRVDEKGMDEYLKSIQKTADQLRDELRPVAVKNIKQSLVLTEAAKAEGIKVEPPDVQTEIETMTKDVAEDRREKLVELLNMPRSQVSLASSIATRRIVDKLVGIAQSPAANTEKSEDAGAKRAADQQEEVK